MVASTAQEHLPAGYAEQRRRIIQLLKDANHPYVLSGLKQSDEIRTQAATPEGYWNISKEQLKRENMNVKVNISHRILRDELERMREMSMYAWALDEVFLHEGAGDNDYEDLQEKAEPGIHAMTVIIHRLKRKGAPRDEQIAALRDGQTPSTKLLTAVNIAIHELTMRLIDFELYAEFADLLYTTDDDLKTNRRITMEENYREINRVFTAWCQEYQQHHKQFITKAYDKTAIETNQSRNTVERAVHFVLNESKAA